MLYVPCAMPPRRAAELTGPCSVLPPPPRYPGGGAYHPGAGLAGIVPLIETNNTLSNPTGPEWQFLVGEGEPSLLAWGPAHTGRPLTRHGARQGPTCSRKTCFWRRRLRIPPRRQS